MLSPKRATLSRRVSAQPQAARIQAPIRSCTSSSCQWPTTTLRVRRSRVQMNPNSRSPWAAWLQVHEVHVDRAPRQVAVELRVEVQEGLLERREAADPHLGRREGVHPEDEPDAACGGVGLGEEGGDLVRRLDDGLEDDAAGDAGRLVERGRDRLRVVRDLLQRLRPVQVLAAGDEPDFGLLQVGDHVGPPAGARRPRLSITEASGRMGAQAPARRGVSPAEAGRARRRHPEARVVEGRVDLDLVDGERLLLGISPGAALDGVRPEDAPDLPVVAQDGLALDHRSPDRPPALDPHRQVGAGVEEVDLDGAALLSDLDLVRVASLQHRLAQERDLVALGLVVDERAVHVGLVGHRARGLGGQHLGLPGAHRRDPPCR